MAFIRNTDKLIEGVVNQFFTDQRAKDAAVVDSSAGNETDQAMSVSALKLYVGGEIDGLDTDDIEEGSSNLYFSDQRAKDAAVVDSSAGNETDQAMSVSAAKLYVGGEIDGLDSDDIEEGSSNLYFTDQRAKDAAVVDSSAGNETDQAMSVSAAKLYVGGEIDGLDSDDIEEGSSNLYFTDQRAKDAVVIDSSAGSETDQSMSVSAAKLYSESQKVEAQKLLGDVEVFSANGSIDGDNMVCLVDLTGGSVTLTLPNISGLATGRKYIIKDQKGLASQSTFITVQRQGATEKIDGQNTYEMKAAYESISVMFDGSNWLVF